MQFQPENRRLNRGCGIVRPYTHLNLGECRLIVQCVWQRSPSVRSPNGSVAIPRRRYCELRRIHYHDAELPELNGCHNMTVQGMYDTRQAVHRRLVIHPGLLDAEVGRQQAGLAMAEAHGREHQLVAAALSTRTADPTPLTNRKPKSICDRLNTAPRKCHGRRTPVEVFRDRFLAEAISVD